MPLEIQFHTGQTTPPIFQHGGREVKPLRVDAHDFFRLFGEDARKHDASAGSGGARQQRSQCTQRIGENVGNHHVVLGERYALRQIEIGLYLVGLRIVAAGNSRLAHPRRRRRRCLRPASWRQWRECRNRNRSRARSRRL